MLYYYMYHTMVGSVTFVEENGALIAITMKAFREGVEEETMLIKRAHLQLQEYLMGKRKRFDLPIKMKGTDFQVRVWKELLNIPYGETRSYKQIAEAIGNPKAMRAVGMANNRNELLMVVPCHRVIGTDGKLVGYGEGLEMKEFLLRLEGIKCPKP